MKLQCEHIIKMSAEDFWANIHEPAMEEMSGKKIGLTEYRELERKETATEIYRKVKVAPPIPETFKMLLSKVSKDPITSYIEEQWRSKKEMVIRWKSTPSFLADKVTIGGTLKIVPVDSKSCKRVLDGDVSVKVFGIGGMIEKAIVKTTIETYGKTSEAANEYATTILKKK